MTTSASAVHSDQKTGTFDGAAVKGTYVMTNVEFQPGMPPTNATATMTLL